jgi:hypothetical protein
VPSAAPMPDGLASEKFEILCAVFERARAQREALEVNDFETFMTILDERDELLSQLQHLVDAMPDLPENVVAFPNELTQRNRDDDQLAIDTVIRGIVEHDDYNETLLNERLATLGDELPALRRGRAATAAYRVQREPRGYIDRRS